MGILVVGLRELLGLSIGMSLLEGGIVKLRRSGMMLILHRMMLLLKMHVVLGLVEGRLVELRCVVLLLLLLLVVVVVLLHVMEVLLLLMVVVFLLVVKVV